MIDNIAVFIFSLAIVFTVFRAIRLDKKLPWFSANIEQEARQLQLEEQKRSKKPLGK